MLRLNIRSDILGSQWVYAIFAGQTRFAQKFSALVTPLSPIPHFPTSLAAPFEGHHPVERGFEPQERREVGGLVGGGVEGCLEPPVEFPESQYETLVITLTRFFIAGALVCGGLEPAFPVDPARLVVHEREAPIHHRLGIHPA